MGLLLITSIQASDKLSEKIVSFLQFFQQTISHSNESPDTLNCIFYAVISKSNDYNFL